MLGISGAGVNLSNQSGYRIWTQYARGSAAQSQGRSDDGGNGKATDSPADAKAPISNGRTAAEAAAGGECQTCKNRKYQDGSDDPGVSFKTAGKINKSVAASTIRAHENEHVKRNAAEAEREGRAVVMSRVVLHTGICPECGETYYSGGTTTTVTRRAYDKAMSLDPQNGSNMSKTTVDTTI